MVKDSLRRTIRFDKKVEGSVYKERIDRYKKRQSINYARTLAKHIEIENAVKQYIANNNIPTIQTNFYILFVKEIISKSIEEVGISLYKWRKRGLEFKHLINLAKIYKTEFKEVDPIEEIPGLIGYWPLIEGRGQIAFDMSGYGHNGTISNALWVKRSKNENTLKFNGDNSHIEIKDMPIYKQKNIKAVSLWVNKTSDSPWGNCHIFIKGAYLDEDMINIQVTTGNPYWLKFVLSDEAGSTHNEVYSLLNENTWYHVVGVVEESNIKLYIDGNLAMTTPITGLPANTDLPVLFGCSYYPPEQVYRKGFNGMIDKIRLYDRPLTEDEIKLIYNKEKI